MYDFRLLRELTEDDLDVAQSFDEYADDYKFIEATGEIVKLPERINIQDRIDSYRSTALDALLDKYLGKDEATENVGYVDHDFGRLYNDLADLGQCIDIANDYRERYGLDDQMSISDVYQFVQSKLDTLNKSIAGNIKSETKKGGDINASKEKIDQTLQQA